VSTLAIDRIACDGRGLCAELLPERITLDEWGYPILDATPVPPGLEREAQVAVSQCPRLALTLRTSGD
jgi:ferredoxin